MGLSNLSNGLGALRFMKPTFQRAALAAVLGLGLVVSAAAQDRAPGAGGPRGPHGGDRQKLFEERRHRQEQRLHDVLQRGKRQRGGQAGERETLTTPERLDRQAQRLADAQQRLQKQSAAVKTFYAVLTVDQRKAFDSMGGLGRGGGFRRGGLVRSRFEGPPIR